MSTEQITKTATKVRDLTARFRGEAALYRLNPPMPIRDWDGEQTGEAEYVAVSAVVAYSGPETYIFEASPEGEVASFHELDGSYRGGLDHGEALKGAGYEVAS